MSRLLPSADPHAEHQRVVIAEHARDEQGLLQQLQLRRGVHERSYAAARALVLLEDPLLEEHLPRLALDVLRAAQLAGRGLEEPHETIEVQVVYVDYLFQGPCLVDFDTRLGTGEVFGLQASGDGARFDTACRLAFESAVLQTLEDRRTVAYLGGP